MLVPGAAGSHCSMGASTMPSPQLGTHGALGKGQRYPVSMVHDPEQPSPDMVLPSSHPSPPSTLPSPHLTTGHAQSFPGTQVQPAALDLQSAEQPSPSFWLPSSHTSPSDDS